MLTNQYSSQRDRGAVLIVALLLAAIIGISLASYIKLANNSLKQAARSFYANSAMNIAEIGLEQTIACFNQLDNVTSASLAWPSTATTDFSGWTLNSTAYNATTSPFTPSAIATFSGFSPGPGATGSVKIYVHYYDGTGANVPTVVAKSTVTQPDGPPIHKYIELTLRKRSLFANGLVARNNVTWSGHPMAASWNSDPDNSSATAAIPYSSSVQTANVTVGSLNGNIGLAGGEVWGYAKTGPTGTITGGSVHGLGTTTDDPARRTNDFNATFPSPSLPNPTTFNTISSTINSDKTLPGATDNFMDVTDPSTGVTTRTYYYKFNSGVGINLGGGDNFQIQAGKNVVMIFNNHQGSSSISTTGTGVFKINSGASLNIYTNGNVSIAGNGMVNDNAQPKQCFIWGTSTSSQTIDVSGNGTLSAVVYAPNGTVALNGGGTSGKMLGSVVASTITMNGDTEFYYDESLANLTAGNPYGISKWRELQSKTERDAYAPVLN